MGIKALVLDFDSTISTPTFLQRVNQWAVADNVTLFDSMSTEERIANFGGKERIAQLASCLGDLKAASVELFIISIGYKAAFVPHLQSVGLLSFFEPQTGGVEVGTDWPLPPVPASDGGDTRPLYQWEASSQ